MSAFITQPFIKINVKKMLVLCFYHDIEVINKLILEEEA